MTIENDLSRIADALELIAGNYRGPIVSAAPSEVSAKKTKKAEKVESVGSTIKVTKETLADALHQVVLTKTPVVAKAILAKFNAARLSEIKEEDYAACFAALEAEVKNG